jgi:hypothetical protein
MRLQTLVIFILTLIGFGLRLHYAVTTHPFFDEYTTVLAARQILHHGWPRLPSGLFYEHGLLATYLITLFTALFINMPLSQWQPAHWGLMLSRWPSVLLGAATIPLIFTLSRRALHPPSPIPYLTSHISHPPSHIALLAAGLFALSPEGMVWGGRARMYALATLLVVLIVYWAYRGSMHPAPARYRWWAILALLAALLTQFGALTLIPPLLISMAAIGWLSWHQNRIITEDSRQRGSTPNYHNSRVTFHARPWFLRPAVLLEGTALAGIIGLAILIKRLGRPLGAAALSTPDSGNLLTELLNTVTYQTAFYFSWPATVDFLTRQFGVSHHVWLALLTLSGGLISMTIWFVRKLKKRQQFRPDSHDTHLSLSRFNLFLWLLFSLIIIEMVTLLEPFRRNPRYLVMVLPLFYLMAAGASHYQLSIINYQLVKVLSAIFKLPASVGAYLRTLSSHPLLALALVVVFTLIGYDDLRIALVTPEPAYEKAFAYIQREWQPGDVLLTMNTPAAGLYLGQVDGFTVQNDEEQFLLNIDTVPVDRWLGVPWIGRAVEFTAILNTHERVWFVIDTIRQPVYFRGDWLAVLDSQMEQVWAEDNALLYRTRPDRVPLPTEPDVLTNATLDNTIELRGFTLQFPNHQPDEPGSGAATQTPEARHVLSELKLTLFWQPLTTLPVDYTTFLHLRNRDGTTVAQRDRQPLDGAYPTSYWQAGETIIDPMTLPLPDTLPAGSYTLVAGLYQLETMERLPVTNASSGENSIILGEITLP